MGPLECNNVLFLITLFFLQPLGKFSRSFDQLWISRRRLLNQTHADATA